MADAAVDPAPQYLRYTDRTQFVQGVVKAVAGALRTALATQPKVALAVPGGRTVAAILPALASQSIPWERVEVRLVDERWVPPTHAASNEALVRALLTSTGAVVRPLFIEGVAAEDAARQLAAATPPDVMLLSMANDGHIGSIFTNDPAGEADVPYVAVKRPDHLRITMTPKLMRAASTVIVAVDSPSKEQVLNKASMLGVRLPVHAILGANAEMHVLSA